jgi:hypothetical protein
MSESRGNPRKVDTLIVNDDDEAPSLLNPMTGQILLTNKVGKRIIELSDGSRDVASIGRQILQEFHGASASDVSQHVDKFLEAGTQKGLVTWTGQI